MKKIVLRAIALFLIFVAAVGAYLYFGQRGEKKAPERIFSGMPEGELPGIWIQNLGLDMNYMRPYTTIPGINVTYDTLTILPPDRKLNLTIEKTKLEIVEISYEIRTADLNDLIEKTDVLTYETTEDATALNLLFQNLLKEGQEYRLDLSIAFNNEKTAHYYTKIMFANQELAKAMVDLAVSFSEKNFDYESARENTTYLESNSTGDNSSMAKVNLKSSYDMLTYNRLQQDIVGEKDVRLTGFDGHMGEISIRFTTRHEGENGNYELYDVFESFTLRQGPERLYMMDYTRTMNEWFLGMEDDFETEKIILGILQPQRISLRRSASFQYEAFVANRDLYLMNTKEAQLKKIFTFRSEQNIGRACNDYKYDVKILRVEDNGDMEFMVFGHMISGEHEGELGISVNHFDYAQNTISERSFIPISTTYEEIRQGVDALAYLGENYVLYLKIADSIYGLDVNTNDYVTIIGNLKDEQMGISDSGRGLAWQSTKDVQGTEVLYYMDLETGKRSQISAAVNEILRIEGFVADDMVVSAVERGEVWKNNNKEMRAPAKLIRIIDKDLNVIKEYHRKPSYLSNIHIEDDRIHMDLLTKFGESTFLTNGADTIVSTSAQIPSDTDSPEFYTSEEKARVHYILLANPWENRKNIVNVPNHISYEQSATINIALSDSLGRYVAIGQGDLLGGYDNIQTAIDTAYINMGSVYLDGKLLYLRADTSSARNLKISDYDIPKILENRVNDKLLDLRGITLKQALYYVSNYMPVLAFSDLGTPLIIYAYDRTQITVYDTSSNQSVKLQMEDAISMFEKSYNDFSTSFTFP